MAYLSLAKIIADSESAARMTENMLQFPGIYSSASSLREEEEEVEDLQKPNKASSKPADSQNTNFFKDFLAALGA